VKVTKLNVPLILQGQNSICYIIAVYEFK